MARQSFNLDAVIQFEKNIMTHSSPNQTHSQAQSGVFGISCPLIYIALSSLAFVLFAFSNVSSAQQPIPIIESPREQLYRDLESEANALLKQHSLLKKIVRATGPGVAHIEAKKRPLKSSTSSSSKRRPVVIEEAGSGVVIQYRGRFYVITNYHVVENATAADIQIEIDGKIYFPNRLIHDHETDLSVLGLTATDLQSSRVGNSDRVEIGDFVVAVGSPFGLSHSVSYGIVSASHRHDLDLGPQGVRYQDFFQTDAAINPGNSGGPLINLKGEVIGINTAIASNSGGSDGIGFSIPINMAMRVVGDLIDYGSVRRGFLGVSLDARFDYSKASAIGLTAAYGALVTSITPDSPASDSRLKVGDVILEYDGKRVNNDSQLVTKVSLTRLNQKVPVKVFRNGKYHTVEIQVRDRQQYLSKK
jgi:serine protease Do